MIDELSILAEWTKVQTTRKENTFSIYICNLCYKLCKVLLTSNKRLRRRQSSPEGKSASPHQKTTTVSSNCTRGFRMTSMLASSLTMVESEFDSQSKWWKRDKINQKFQSCHRKSRLMLIDRCVVSSRWLPTPNKSTIGSDQRQRTKNIRIGGPKIIPSASPTAYILPKSSKWVSSGNSWSLGERL
jgi:hypothetical protein